MYKVSRILGSLLFVLMVPVHAQDSWARERARVAAEKRRLEVARLKRDGEKSQADFDKLKKESLANFWRWHRADFAASIPSALDEVLEKQNVQEFLMLKIEESMKHLTREWAGAIAQEFVAVFTSNGVGPKHLAALTHLLFGFFQKLSQIKSLAAQHAEKIVVQAQARNEKLYSRVLSDASWLREQLYDALIIMQGMGVTFLPAHDRDKLIRTIAAQLSTILCGWYADEGVMCSERAFWQELLLSHCTEMVKNLQKRRKKGLVAVSLASPTAAVTPESLRALRKAQSKVPRGTL